MVPKSIIIPLCLITLTGILRICGDENKDSDEQEDFVPTDEWKEIKKDQVVPAGLHYRINLQTGKKEAKLLSESETDFEDDKKRSLVIVDTDDTKEQKTTDSIHYDPIKIKEKLKKIKNDDPNFEQIVTKNKFRSYEELKKDMQELNLNSKSDSELLKDLFEEYKKEIGKKTPDEELLVDILEDFIYLAHQFDNALDFVKLDGFKSLIYKNLNSSSVELRESALRLFSSLVQNNAKVKIYALESGALPILLRILSNDVSNQVQLRAVTSLSCLLRTFPFAQIEFVKNGGLSIVSDIFKSDFVKLKSKLATLMTDLLDERKKDKQNFENHKFIDLESELLKIGWCENLNDLLKDLYVIDIEDHDSLEKCLLSLQAVTERCNETYNKNLLFNMYENYEILAKEDDDSEYFSGLSNLCKNLAQIEERQTTKTEL